MVTQTTEMVTRRRVTTTAGKRPSATSMLRSRPDDSISSTTTRLAPFPRSKLQPMRCLNGTHRIGADLVARHATTRLVEVAYEETFGIFKKNMAGTPLWKQYYIGAAVIGALGLIL